MGKKNNQPQYELMQPRDAARRTLLLCLTVMLVPVLLCLALYIVYSSHTMEQEIYRNMQMSVEQARNNMDSRMSQLERSAHRILNAVYPYLTSDADYSGQLEEYSEISKLLSENQSQNMITKLRLYVPGEKSYSRQRDSIYALDSLPLNAQSRPFGPGSYWQGTHPITVQFGYPQVQVISCVATVSSITNYNNVVGVLFLDMDIAPFQSMLSAGMDEDSELFIIDAGGEVLIHPDSSRIGTVPFLEADIETLSRSAVSGRFTIDGEQRLMVSRQLDYADWFLVMTVPTRNVYSAGVFSLDLARAILLILIFASLAVALAVTYNTLVRTTVRRINLAIGSTIDTMAHEGLKPIEEAPRVNRDDSTLLALEQNTNLMASTITQLLESRYEDQLAVRDFQMQALQAQINPHFLYNTLDVIKWMIADGQNEDGIWMINALSRYFQLSLSQGRDIVRVSEEVRLTQTYIGIMQKRFKGVFTATFEVEPETEDCQIPKLSLQPIVENALLHGILYADKPEKTLFLRIMAEDGKMIVEVEDNGNGMDEATRAAIFSGEGESNKGYGLSNVIRRMQLFGAGEDDFIISSRPGVGTCVTIILPMRRAEDLNDGEIED